MDFYTPTGLHVFFQHPVENINVEKVIGQIEEIIPHHLLSEVEMIIFGWFKEFEERSINAFYNDNALYISHLQEDEKDLFDDIVHEISHSLEGPYGYEIYADDKIKDEFLRKRMYLHDILWKSGYRAPKAFFADTEYNEEFDMFLYEKIGYDKLSGFMQGVYLNPYAATSLREYFATGFTEFFTESEHNFMKKVSPALYQKLVKMQNPVELDT
jgi:hypothetical protein|tara:strand:- start:18251 stop:18889 length:639 start_codon:yes stop_codon:yes gene_type:complete